MRIAIVTETFPPEINGVAMTFGLIAQELGRRGHGVSVWRPKCARKASRPAEAPYSEVEVPGLPIPGYPLLRFGLPAGRLLRQAWTAARPDLVHVVTEGPLGASAVSAARSLGIPVTSSFHTNFHAYTRAYGAGALRGVTLAWLRRVHNRTALTFAPTAELCAELESAGFKNLSVLSRGINTWQFHPSRLCPDLRAQWGAAPHDPVVLHVGRLTAEKNYPLILEAHAAMRAANPACRFVFVGDGPLRSRLQRENEGTIFTGFVSPSELARHYASADIFVYGSVTETFGNVVLEALASGLAVAAFDYAATREFVANGVNGLAVPLDDPDALVAAAVLLASDEPLQLKLRQAARASVESHSWDKVIARFETELQSVAGLAAPAPAPTFA